MNSTCTHVSRLRRLVAALTAVWMLLGVAPAQAGNPVDDLKQIEYRYYFRGKYAQAIESLQTFLARTDVREPLRTRAREFLAASYVLGGAPDMGRDVFASLVSENPTYPGPDSNVFKLEVVNVYAQARADQASLALRNPAHDPTRDALDSKNDDKQLATAPTGKPIYKKWWLYAGVAGVALAALAMGGGDDGGPPPADRGGLIVGVEVK